MSDRGAPAILARGLARAFGSVRALDRLDLEVPSGTIVGVLGPNGSGKTTFIRVLAGLLRPTSGEVTVLGRRPGLATAAHVGYMTQAPALYEDLTVRENLVFFGRLCGLSTTDARGRADDLTELVSLSEKSRTPVRDLSGGMRQRTNLACAMIHRPRLLLLDEPTVGVDPALRVNLWEHFRSLNAEGSTILVTTHVMDEADRCDTIALIEAGRAIAEGTPAELRERAGASTIEDAYLWFARRRSQESS
jgi:ABC-2 type transport system ATP-binding protein